MFARFFRTLVILAVISLSVPSAAQTIPSETWMGIYLGKSHIGYARLFIGEDRSQGKPGYRLESTSVTKLLVLGTEVEQNLQTTACLDKKFEPVYQEIKMSSGGHTTSITAKFNLDEVIAEVEAQGKKSIKKIPIPRGSRILGHDTLFLSESKLKPGDKTSFKWFNPLSLSLDDIQMEVLRKEPLKLGEETVEAFVIKSRTPLGDMTCWQDEKGDLLKVISLMGLTMIREPKEAAQSLQTDAGVYTPPSDLAIMTSAQTGTEIPYPRHVRHMKVRLSGLADRSLAISDLRQRVTWTQDEHPVAEYEIKAAEFFAPKATKLPIEGPELEKFLADTPYVQATDPEIASVAAEIAGSEKNAYTVASRLRAWVNKNMQSKGNIGIVRPSVDILHGKTGVCRDYAILYSALARAAGVPTKLVAGLVFWKGGFYYHAWAESFVGEWIPVDPTLSTDFVDATHIKLTEGEATAMFDMVKTMGTVKAEIVEFK